MQILFIQIALQHFRMQNATLYRFNENQFICYICTGDVGIVEISDFFLKTFLMPVHIHKNFKRTFSFHIPCPTITLHRGTIGYNE